MIFSILASVAAVYLAASATRNRLRFIRRNAWAMHSPQAAEGLTWTIGIVGLVLILVAIWACRG